MDHSDYRAIRERLLLSCGDLAKALDVSRETIRLRESGQKPIRSEAWLALERIAHLMGLELTYQPGPDHETPDSAT